MGIDPHYTVTTLQDLIRLNTTNPPGNESIAAEYIAAQLDEDGIPCEILESTPGRGSIVARLEGDGTGEPLLLMSHTDVVPSDADQWSRDPFCGDLVDGYVWGRGAVDTKCLTAMQLNVFRWLKRGGLPLKRDVIFTATADEEVGGKYGMQWLVDNHWDKIACKYALNEGGGLGLRLGGKRIYVCQTAEKGTCWMRVTMHGVPGHGSTPRGETAVSRLVDAFSRLAHARLPRHHVATVDRFVREVAATQSFPASIMLPLVLNPLFENSILKRVGQPGDILPAFLRASLHNTATPTGLNAGSNPNVIPPEATGQIDGRLLPGQRPDDLVREIKPHLGDDAEIEFITTSTPYESDFDSPLYKTIQQVIAEHDPDGVVVPFLITGSTDGRCLAPKGVQVYGFAPMKDDPQAPIFDQAHAPNERISVENLEFGTRILWDIVRRFVTA